MSCGHLAAGAGAEHARAIQANWLLVLERVLKLSMPTLYGWVLIFYLLFHVWAEPAGRGHPVWRPRVLQGESRASWQTP